MVGTPAQLFLTLISVTSLSLKCVQIPFEVPGLAVLGVRHEDVALSGAVIGNWQQRQLQKQHALADAQSHAAVYSVLRPRSCRQNQSAAYSFTGNFLAECEFASAADLAPQLCVQRHLLRRQRLFWTADWLSGKRGISPLHSCLIFHAVHFFSVLFPLHILAIGLVDNIAMSFVPHRQKNQPLRLIEIPGLDI